MGGSSHGKTGVSSWMLLLYMCWRLQVGPRGWLWWEPTGTPDPSIPEHFSD